MAGKTINTADAPQAIGPYSQAVEAGGFLFVSGQIPVDPASGRMLDADVKAQTRLVMENAKAVLAAAGYGMQHVVKCTLYLRKMSNFGEVNTVYGEYFPSAPPARATVEVSKLPKDAALEIDFIAAKSI